MSAALESQVPWEALTGRRVLIIVENLPAPFDRRVWLEARTLRAAGASVSIISPKGEGCAAKFEVLEGIKIYRHDLPKESRNVRGYCAEYLAAFFAQTWLAWKIFLTDGFDILHACNPPDLIVLVALPFKLLGRKFIFDHHDLSPELFEAKFGRRGFLWRVLLMLERLTFMAADVSIATNDSYRRIAINRGAMWPDKVFVVRSGPDMERFKPVPTNPKLRQGRRFLVGYLGVMGEQEGIDLLLASVAHIVQRLGRHDIQFVLAGDGPSALALKALSARLGVEAYVTFLGRVPDYELLELLSSADVCVNPDRVNAMNDLSTMNKILEYMAIGKPIVQFDVKEGRVSAGAAALYATPNNVIDFADKILELLADEPLRTVMGQIGQARVMRDLCWRRQIPALIEAYRACDPKPLRRAPAALPSRL